MRVHIKGKPFDVAPEPADYWGWIEEGRYDHEWTVYDHYLKPAHTFIDLGAWVGGHTLYGSSIARLTYAFEPDPVAFAILEQNVKGLPIHITRTAVTGARGEVTLGSGWLGASTTRLNLAAGGGIGEATQLCTAPSIALREFAEALPDPLFIKMDVEGAEEEILKDIDFFREHKPTVLIETHPFWWKDPLQAAADFAAVKDLYATAFEVPHPNSKTWVLLP